MRARGVPAGPVPPRGRSRPSVLLTTEGTYPGTRGGVAAWCDLLVRGLTEADFLVLDLPAWNAGNPAEAPARRRRGGSMGDAEREFVPRLRAFLAATIDPDGPGETLAAALLDLRDHFRRFDAAAAWRSRGAWEAVRDHLLIQTPDAAREHVGPAGGDRMQARASDDLPTIGEAVDALAWLGRMLAPLTVKVPRVDLVHATSAGFSALPGILARVERGTPLLLSEHAIAPRDLYLTLHRLGAPFHLKRFAADVAGAVSRTAYLVADRIAPASRHLMRWELAYGAPRTSIEVVDTGVDELYFQPVPVDRDERPTVVQIARIEPAKGQDVFIRVADLVRREIPDVLFLQFGEVGDRSFWESLRHLRADRDLEDVVRFAGPTPDVPRALGLADLALVTSRTEAFPFSVVEASMCGLPVVATDVGGVREALDGAGITAPADDAAALAEAVAATLRVSPEQRERLRESAREQAVTRFGVRRMLEDHRRLYAALSPAAMPHEAAPVEEPKAEAAEKTDEIVVIPEAVADEPVSPTAQVRDEERADEPAGPEGPSPVPEGIDIIVPGAAPEDRIEVSEELAGPEPAETGGGGSTVDTWIAAAWAVDAARAAREHETARPDRPLHPVVGAEPPAVDLRARLADPDPVVRVDALSRLDDPSSADFAGAALEDDIPRVRQEAVRALGRLNGPRAGRWLAQAVSRDPNPEVRGAAVDALAALLSRPQDEPGARS